MSKKSIGPAWRDLLHLEVDLLFFDTTSTYFESEDESELKKRGFSKDKRGDLPQVVIGLAVTREGIPVKHWLFPGNTADMSTIQKVKKDLAGWRLNRCIIVHDCGMTSEVNSQYLQRGGGHYIVGRKMKSGEADVEEALSKKGRYSQIDDHLWAKEVIIGNGEKCKRLVVVKNANEQKRAEKTRQKLVETLTAKLSELNTRKLKSHNKVVCELKSHRLYGKYIKEQKSCDLLLLTGPQIINNQLIPHPRIMHQRIMPGSNHHLPGLELEAGIQNLHKLLVL